MPTEAIQSALTNQMMSLFDFYKPQYANELFRQHGDQFLPLFQILRSMGRETSVSADTWYAYEDQYIVENFKSANGIAVDPGAGVAATITLDATDVNAVGQSYPRDGFIVAMPNGTQARISSKTIGAAPTYTTTILLTPVDNTKTLGTHAAGQMLWISSGAWADGTGHPEAATRGAVRRQFWLQNFKERIGAEGGQLANETWMKKWDDGGEIIGWYNPQMMDLDYRLSLIIDGAFWLGNQNTSGALTQTSAISGAANPVWTTVGLIPTIQARGLTVNHGGAVAITDFDTWSTYLTQQRVTSRWVMMMNGISLNNLIENAMVSYLKNTSVNYTEMVASIFGGDQQLAASIGFNLIRKANYTYMFKVNENFSNPKTFGTTGYDFENKGIIVPLMKMKDPITGSSINNLETKYKALGKYSRRFKMFTLSGAGEIDQYVTDVDGTNTYQAANLGLQIVKANQMIYLEH